jgi:hypothetical protein
MRSIFQAIGSVLRTLTANEATTVEVPKGISILASAAGHRLGPGFPVSTITYRLGKVLYLIFGGFVSNEYQGPRGSNLI